MNLVERTYKVYLKEIDELDYMVFDLKTEVLVCMNDENCQSDLKKLFTNVLEELLESTVKLEYEERKEYKKGLYIDVCKEYIKELNREIKLVSKNIPDKIKKIE